MQAPRSPHPIARGLVVVLIAAGCVAAVCIGWVTRPRDSAPAASIRAVDAAGLKRALDSQKGKVVLVNFWATWCEPCVEEFPDLVELYRRYRGRGLVVFSISMDEPEDLGKVEAFIREHRAAFPVYTRGPGSPSDFVSAIDTHFEGAVPATYVFGKDGKQVGEPQVGLRTLAQITALIEPLLR